MWTRLRIFHLYSHCGAAVSRYPHYTGSTVRRLLHNSGLPKAAVRQLFFGSGDRCAAIISKSQDIFENLAFEDWLYENIELHEDDHLLLLWRNSPAVVIGKFQNPWAECAVHDALDVGVAVCRRRSGGGTVYHDIGNINCSFFTHRTRYRRKDNLAVVVDALRSRWSLDVSINQRDDILLNGLYKISGTAAKLGRNVAYHHCTLLVEADCSAISRFLQTAFDDKVSLECTATQSTRALTVALKDADKSVSCDQVMLAIISAHAKRFSKFGGEDAVPTIVNPADTSLFSDIHRLYADLRSWSWVYGRTPDFKIKLSLSEIEQSELHFHIVGGTIVSVAGLFDTSTIETLNYLFTNVPLCPLAIQRAVAQRLDTQTAACRQSAAKVVGRLLASFRFAQRDTSLPATQVTC